jgi:hypothetical protein
VIVLTQSTPHTYFRHNTHQYSLFFEAIRTHVRAGTLGELKRRLLDALKHGRPLSSP